MYRLVMVGAVRYAQEPLVRMALYRLRLQEMRRAGYE
jgi:hypothetical protein